MTKKTKISDQFFFICGLYFEAQGYNLCFSLIALSVPVTFDIVICGLIVYIFCSQFFAITQYTLCAIISKIKN